MSQASIIVISGQIPVRPGQWERAQAIAQKHQEASRKEPGCLEFAFSRDLEDPNCLRFFERWQSDEALAAHLAGPAVAATNAVLPEVVAGKASILKFAAAPLPFP